MVHIMGKPFTLTYDTKDLSRDSMTSAMLPARNTFIACRLSL